VLRLKSRYFTPLNELENACGTERRSLLKVDKSGFLNPMSLAAVV